MRVSEIEVFNLYMEYPGRRGFRYAGGQVTSRVSTVIKVHTEQESAGALGVAQPDACRAGGISECGRVARMAGESGVGIGTHTWSDAVALMANAHFVAAMPNRLTVEVDRTGNSFIEEVLTGPLQIIGGLLHLPKAPGLGIDLSEAALQRLKVPPGRTIPDGNYSDLIFGREYFGTAPPYRTN